MPKETFFAKLKDFFKKYFFNPSWRCLSCNKEIFTEDYFCADCAKTLPYVKPPICNHCGRAVIGEEEYCSTCKNILVDIDKSRSVFNYKDTVAKLIKRAKYNGKRFILDYFACELANLYVKENFAVDYITYVPMTKKALRKRGYNQSQYLANGVGNKVGVPVIDCLAKTKETVRQAKLTRNERLKNLQGAFSVTMRKEVKGKSILLIDDVTTTGSTAQVIAHRLKRAGASKVYVLTVASVPPIENY